MKMSPQAQAIIMLTVPFGKTETRPLSIKEWGRFALWLRDHDLEPGSLLTRDPRTALSSWMDKTVKLERIESLLQRGGALGLALEKWERSGLWVITRSDNDYPEQLKRMLRASSPPVLFGCGNASLLSKGGIAVVGSRNSNDEDLSFSTNLGREASNQGLSIVSGGARGVDESAMLGALDHEGTAVGILADSLLRAATSSKYRRYLVSGDLALVSPFNPEASFNVGNAMARNKYIYCLSDAAVVVDSAVEKGGTWNGAVENLNNQWVPLWVKQKDDEKSGNAALVKMGARWLPKDMPSLTDLWSAQVTAATSDEPQILALEQSEKQPSSAASDPRSSSLEHATEKSVASDDQKKPAKVEVGDAQTAADSTLDLFTLFLQHFSKLTIDSPLPADAIADQLDLQKSQVNAWLKRGISEGVVRKLTKPVRYELCSSGVRQASLFEN
ncbi:DNA-processing protein DprA [Qipengyuania sphaerica]|uniref:DNA-processing protein DprA n=1 Tax=Qipengyuania sphaerica TaxID=2867243 RepID=UPI001C871D0E|nr:DNA-processing protein DprA [Qipengyuania sphaerica]MBX7540305.1 DNA-protecting protein DprA [Qipengyuania sphaerica]